MEVNKEQKKEQEKKVWKEVKHMKRFSHAFRGLRVLAETTPHIYMYKGVSLIAILLGYYFKITSTEWIELVFAIGFVFVAEAFNTAIEIDIDLTSPEYHPYARDTKDVAAGAVLLSVFVAIIIGLIIFLPRVAQIARI